MTTSLDPAIAARLKRTADGLVPAVVQQHDTGEVLMLGLDGRRGAGADADHRPGDVLEPSPRRSTGSRARPPATVQWVQEVRLDCDGDTLLVKVDQGGAACHTGDRTCFDADVLLPERGRGADG